MKKILETMLLMTCGGIILILAYLIVQLNTQNRSVFVPDIESADSQAVFQPTIESVEPVQVDPEAEKQELDIGNFTNQEYSLTLLSMFSTEEFDLDRVFFYTACVCQKNEHVIQNLAELSQMLDYIPSTQEIIYLILAPDRIYRDLSYDSEQTKKMYRELLGKYMENHRETWFYLTFPYYSLPYLQAMSPEERLHLTESYRDLYDTFREEPNVRMFFWGDLEWLVANPGNYTSESTCVPVTTEKLTCFWNDRLFMLTDENLEKRFANLQSLMQKKSPNELLTEYDPVDGLLHDTLSSRDIVFFGDSVFGLFPGPDSIPGVIESLSGAHTYNLAIGGTSAAMRGGDIDRVSLNAVIDAFLSENLNAINGTNAVIGLQKYIEDHQDIVFRKPCFVISFGFNDYFSGVAVEYPDSSDDNIYTYKGALYTAVRKLKKHYPVSTILVLSPNYIKTIGADGKEVKYGSEGEILKAYVMAARETAEALHVDFLDGYTQLGFNDQNMNPYMRDGVHPGELGRYLYGKLLIKKLTQ